MDDLNGVLESALKERLREHGIVPRKHRSDGAGPQPDFDVVIPGATGPVIAVVDVRGEGSSLDRKASDRGTRQTVKTTPQIVGERYISPARAARYRAAGVQYIDSGGNAWLDLPGFHVHVEGRKTELGRAASSTRAFTRAGLRVTFALLISPWANPTVREIADAADVSIGTTHAALRSLRAEDLITPNGSVAILDAPRLARLWVDQYALREAGRYEEWIGPEPVWWQDQPNAAVELSGEAALQFLGYGVRPLTTTVYAAPDERVELIRTARLRPALKTGSGNVYLRERFWVADPEPTVPKLLIYADALASGDPRQKEAAEMMWAQDHDLRRFHAG